MSSGLDETYLETAQFILEQARSLEARFGTPRLIEQRLEFQETGTTQGPRTIAAPHMLIRRLWDEGLWQSGQLINCARQHLDAGVLKSPEKDVPLVRSSQDTLRQLAWVLIHPLIHLVERQQSLEVKSSDIIETYSRFREAWAGRLECEAIIPISGLDGVLSPTTIGPLRLAIFRSKEKTELFGRWLDQNYLTVGALSRVRYVLSAKQTYTQEEEASVRRELLFAVE